MGILVPLVLFDTKHCNPVKYLGHCYLWQLWMQAQAEFASYSGMSGEEIEVFSWWFMVSWFFFTSKSAYIPFAAVCNKDMREAVNGCTRVMRWRWWRPSDVLPFSLMCVGAACSWITCSTSGYTMLHLLPWPKIDGTYRVWLPRCFTVGCGYLLWRLHTRRWWWCM